VWAISSIEWHDRDRGFRAKQRKTNGTCVSLQKKNSHAEERWAFKADFFLSSIKDTIATNHPVSSQRLHHSTTKQRHNIKAFSELKFATFGTTLKLH
jgi:hypothetical protein